MSSTMAQQHPFISYLQGRAEDRAMLAALRRGLGARLADQLEQAGIEREFAEQQVHEIAKSLYAKMDNRRKQARI